MSMSADERKLQPVFDDIHAGRYKFADAAITRHLKKTPKSQTALVARFVLLHEQHVPSPSRIQALNALRKMGELSPGNFWRTERALKEMKRWDLVMVINREAADRHPESEQHIAQLHLCAVSCWDHEVMASTARKLFNSTKDVAWARRAAWAEWAKNAPQPSQTKPIPLPAPEGSLKIASLLLSTTRRPGLDTAPTSDTLWLHMQILLSAREHRKAHDLLIEHGQNGGLARDWYRMQGIQEIGRREEEEAGSDVMWVWETELSDWLDTWRKDHLARRNYAYYRHSIVAARALLTSRPDLVERLLQELVGLDREIGAKERAPKLARLELDLELRKASSDLAMSSEEWEKEILAYWTSWGSKGPVVPELEGVMGERQAWLREVMEKRLPAGHSDERSFRGLVNAHLFVLRSHPADWQATEEDIGRLWKLYTEGLEYGKNLTDKDVQPADQVGLAAVQLILYTPTNEATLRAIVCLENMLDKSPACAYAKFLLVKLYRLIGAPELATDRLSKLGLSEIQLDTLIHVWLDGAAVDEELKVLTAHASPMYRMYNSSAVHLPENLRQAITQESYSKVHSMRELHQAQMASRTRASLHLELDRAGGQVDEEEAARLAKLTAADLVDTRDWELMPSIGGGRPALQDLSHLQLKEDSPEALLFKIRIERAFRQYSKGEQVDQSSIALESSALSGTDGKYYTALQKVLDRVTGRSDAPLNDVFDGIMSPSLDGTRWSALQGVASIREARDHCQLVQKGLNANHPDNGKRKTKLPIVDELDSVIRKLEEANKRAKNQLEDLVATDQTIDWVKLMGGLIEDTDFINRRAEALVEARRNAVHNNLA